MKVFVVVEYKEDDLYTQDFQDVFSSSNKAEKYVEALDGKDDDYFVDWEVIRDKDGDITKAKAKVLTEHNDRRRLYEGKKTSWTTLWTKYLIIQKEI